MLDAATSLFDSVEDTTLAKLTIKAKVTDYSKGKLDYLDAILLLLL